MPRKSVKKIVFILSNGRSGSTLLAKILGSHSTSINLGEFIHADKSIISKKKQKILLDEGVCLRCGPDCSFWQSFYPPNKRLHEYAFKKLGKKIIIDSSKDYKWAHISSKRTDAEIKLIRLTRNGLNRFGAYKKRGKELKKLHITSWVRHEKEISRYLRKKEHLQISHSEICSPKGIRECCDFIGMNYEPGMMKFWESDQHAMRGSRTLIGATEIRHETKKGYTTKEDIALFNRWGGGKINKELGY